MPGDAANRGRWKCKCTHAMGQGGVIGAEIGEGRNVDSLKIIQIHDKFHELEATLHNFLVVNFLEKSFCKHPSGWSGKELCDKFI